MTEEYDEWLIQIESQQMEKVSLLQPQIVKFKGIS